TGLAFAVYPITASGGGPRCASAWYTPRVFRAEVGGGARAASPNASRKPRVVSRYGDSIHVPALPAPGEGPRRTRGQEGQVQELRQPLPRARNGHGGWDATAAATARD